MATQDPMTVKTPEAGEMPVRSERLVKIIRYLVNNQRLVGCMSKGQVLFQFRENQLSVSLTSYEDMRS